MKAIILAGGSGTRLWPMSRATKPKQFCDVIGKHSLIRQTYDRLLPSFQKEDIYFSVSPTFSQILRDQFPDLSEDHIFVEPERRDTGPAMGYVAAMMELVYPEEPMVFIPSDHFIEEEKKFLICLSVADELIRSTGKMVDIGIVPAFASSTLGYTKIADKFDVIQGVEIYKFAGHKEKPTIEVAEEYVKTGEYLWHANYYSCTPRGFMAAIEKYAPEIATLLRRIQKGESNLYAELPKISFDYAVTEKMDTSEVLILKGDFGWSDIGAWDTLKDRLPVDADKNTTKGRVLLKKTGGSLVYSSEKKLVAVIGMENLIVVDTPDVLLICRREDAQGMKEVLSDIEKHGWTEYL
jgi:mannose-1-phosphate guanylyltransferase